MCQDRWNQEQCENCIYFLDPNVRTRGGYTALMLAGLSKRHDIYNLLVETYTADENIRDYSGRTADQYLDMHHMVVCNTI